jgi:tetratricopeptide (TPR) repeat protein
LSIRYPQSGLDYLRRAAVISPHDPLVEINLALAYSRLSQATEADGQFLRATADGPAWSPAWSSYGQWLLAQNRIPAALEMAYRAVHLDPYDLTGRRTVMDVMVQNHLWAKLIQFAKETLRLFPNDPDGQRSIEVGQTGLDQIGKAETVALRQPSVNNYLALSVIYYQTQRYEDCIAAAREALKVNPNQAEAYANMAAAYHTLGKLDETIAALTEEVRLNPTLQSAKSNLEIELAAKKAKSGR